MCRWEIVRVGEVNVLPIQETRENGLFLVSFFLSRVWNGVRSDQTGWEKCFTYTFSFEGLLPSVPPTTQILFSLTSDVNLVNPPEKKEAMLVISIEGRIREECLKLTEHE